MVAIIENHIDSDLGVRGGKPYIKGTRMTVADIVLMHFRLGQSLEEIAGKYDLSLASVHAALAFYFDHRNEIDRSIDEDHAFAEAFRRNNVSPLQEKLRALGNG